MPQLPARANWSRARCELRRWCLAFRVRFVNALYTLPSFPLRSLYSPSFAEIAFDYAHKAHKVEDASEKAIYANYITAPKHETREIFQFRKVIIPLFLSRSARSRYRRIRVLEMHQTHIHIHRVRSSGPDETDCASSAQAV